MDGALGCIEQLDDLADARTECFQYGDYLFVSEPKGGLVERYVKGKQGIAFRYRKILASGEPRQDGFVVMALDWSNAPRSNLACGAEQQVPSGVWLELKVA